jgi:hypothetical protein
VSGASVFPSIVIFLTPLTERSTLSHPTDTLGNRDTNLDLDLVAWTEGLLQARYPTLMPPATIKLVVAALQMSGFASLWWVVTDIVIASLLLVGIWLPYLPYLRGQRQASAFTPARSWIARSLYV